MKVEPSIIIAVIALVGVILTALWNRSTKKLELVYVKKADAYRAFLEKTSVLAHDSDPNKHYPDYLMAFHASRLVASPKVQSALAGDESINQAVQLLRSGDPDDPGRRERIRSNVIHPAMERVITEMNADLRSHV